MKNTLLTLTGAAAVFLAVAQTSNALPIVGNIGFSGSVQLDSGNIATATSALNWFGTVVTPNSTSGDFLTTLGSAGGQPVTMTTLPWSFNSLAIPSFWAVGTLPTFTFNLVSSAVKSNDGTFLNVVLTGTVTALGFDSTTFNGTFQVANPPADGLTTFTERLSFNSVPDGGSTVMLLGAALSGLALIKRKFQA